MVEAAVAAPGQPVDLARSRRHLDGGGAVAGGEVIPAGKAGHVANVADDRGGDDRPGSEQPSQAGPGRPDRYGQLLPGLADLGVDMAQVLGERGGELAARRLHGPGWCDRCQDARGLACGDLPGDAAGHQLAQHLVQPAGDLGAGAAQVAVALGPQLEHRRVIITLGLPAAGRAQRRDRNRAGIAGSFLLVFPDSSSRTRAASLGGTSSTRSPAASSC
jgi:hypothetical protein